MFGECDKQYPSRSGQTSLATAVANITKPVTKNNFGPNHLTNPRLDVSFCLDLRHLFWSVYLFGASLLVGGFLFQPCFPPLSAGLSFKITFILCFPRLQACWSSWLSLFLPPVHAHCLWSEDCLLIFFSTFLLSASQWRNMMAFLCPCITYRVTHLYV